ncbi:MAG: ABC transporter permease [Acidobacteria bacterium]|nr:MAG: ABC transporter permease [Acidobacteriota bacterium]PYR07234.1 MAG: ABC transporter permease [Acidobacteriota bacterium]
MLRTLAADLRYAFRVLVRTPSFLIAVVAVLAIGIGANTAIFSIVNAVLLRPLPFDEPDRLVRLFHIPPQSTFPGLKRFSVSPANFYDWKRDARLFERMAIYRFRQFALTGGSDAESVVAGAVGTDFFEVVRARPALGRVFLREEDAPDRGHVVILSDGFWKSRFGAATDVVGRTLKLDGEPYTIVGVMPARFSVTSWAASARDLWVPLAYTDEERAVRENHNAQVIARLKPGITVGQAQSEMTVISTRLEHEYPQANAGWGATVIPLQELIVGDIRVSLVMLLGAVALVLLIACANVGNLLFARGLMRRKELAIRSALGAGRGRVFQQLLVESLVLASAGGAAGLFLARVGLRAGAALLAKQVPRADEITIDVRVLLFVAGASILTGILAGALPALRAGRTDLNDALKEGGRHEGAVGVRTRRLLVVCEVALSLVLLMGAGVMLRSLLALRHVDAGYDPRNVLTMHVSLPETRYSTPAQKSAFFDQALQRIRALPGVEAAGAIDDLPAQGGSVQPIVLEGHAELLPRDQPTVEVRKITPGYLRAMRIPLLRGRDVADRDAEVMLVSRSAAALLWGDADPIGRRVTLPLQSKIVVKEIIGIVGDVKQGELSAAAGAAVYEYTHDRPWGSLSFAVRTMVPPASLAQSAAGIVRAIDPEEPVEDIRTMEAVVDETLTSQRFSALLLGMFAAVALVLASVGIYSVLSYIVRGRSHEIGIRTALGAGTADVVRLVVVEGMTPAIVGIAAGAVAALGSARILEKLVFGVSASDPLTLAAVAGALALVALVASLVPAYRASRLDPLNVLRSN